MARICDTDWLAIWIEDKNCIIDIMISNMQSDLKAGYNPTSKAITDQQKTIELYKFDMNEQIKRFAYMEDSAVNRWCYYDLLARGAITAI